MLLTNKNLSAILQAKSERELRRREARKNKNVPKRTSFKFYTKI